MIGTVDNPSLAGKIIQGLWFGNERLKSVGMQILLSAGFKCSSCGFVSRPSKTVPHAYMVPVDPSHPGLAAQSLKAGKCLCPLCASARAINWSVVEHRTDHAEVLPIAGSLIWLPEIEQSKISLISTFTMSGINHLDMSHDLAETVKHADGAFRGRKTYLANNIPLYKEDRDSDFARALSLLDSEYYEFRAEVLKGVRFWPNSSFWKVQTHYWLKGVYETMINDATLPDGVL
jgi:hypothetical protein